MGPALAVLIAASAAQPALLSVEVLGREAPRELRVSGAAVLSCDGRALPPGPFVQLRWAQDAVLVETLRGGTRRCKNIHLSAPCAAQGQARAPGAPAGCAQVRGGTDSAGERGEALRDCPFASSRDGRTGVAGYGGDAWDGACGQGAGLDAAGHPWLAPHAPCVGERCKNVHDGWAGADPRDGGAARDGVGEQVGALGAAAGGCKDGHGTWGPAPNGLRKNVPVVDGDAPGTCGARPGLGLRAGAVRRCFAGTLHVTSAARALRLLLRVPLEAYVASVVAAEAADAPGEAQAAQAVVTRTWALAHRGRHGDADVCDLTHCQLFRGGWSAASARAAARTSGTVLVRDGALLPAFFHAACGGYTASARDIFGEPGPGGVQDLGPGGKPWCAEPPWAFTTTCAALSRALSLSGPGAVRVLGRTPDGRAASVEAFGRALPGPRFVARVGRALGYRTLRSARFRVEQDGARLRFVGEGRGHGVGYCQAGAAARARAGQRWDELLRAYFPDARAISPPP